MSKLSEANTRRRTISLATAVAWLSCLLGVSGCGPQTREGELPVYPITGTVLVDGKPMEGIQVALHNVKGVDREHTTYPQGFTGAQGQVEISTYASGDGAPEGEYRVTFVFKPYDPLSHSFSGEDRLGGKYGDSEKSTIKLIVGPDNDNDLGTLELSAKSP